MLKSRVWSAAICLLYLAHAWISLDHISASVFTLYLAIALSCVWFGDELGGYIGYSLKGSYIDQKTPGWMIRFIGWGLLLLPLLIEAVARTKRYGVGGT